MVSISQETMANVVGEKGRLSKTMSTVSASLSSKASAVPRAHKNKVIEEHLVISPAEVILDTEGDSQFLKR